MADILSATIELRQQAWATVRALPAFEQFLALDAAVVAMGGSSLISQVAVPKSGDLSAAEGPGETTGVERRLQKLIGKTAKSQPRSKISHAEAAYIALVKAGNPLTSSALLKAAREEGAIIGGKLPLVNLTSTLSRNDEFVNFRFNGVPHWWLADKPLPYDWRARIDDDRHVNQFDISTMFDEKGDDDDAAAITSKPD